jgi:hypothetical protein
MDDRKPIGWTPASIAKAIFSVVFNTALTLGAAFVAFYLVAINFIGHGTGAVPVMLAVIAAFIAGVLMAWVCVTRHSKPPFPPPHSGPDSD